jgi:hypothetical protein
MTNKPLSYSFHKRMGLTTNKKIVRSTCIQLADKEDVTDVWNLSKFHRHTNSIPYKDSIDHLIRNPRCSSAITLLHTSEVSSCPEKDYNEGLVITEDVVGFCCVKPVDRPAHTTKLYSGKYTLFTTSYFSREEEVALLIYETLTQYVLAKVTTNVPTKLEVTTWLTPTENSFFKTVVNFVNALFMTPTYLSR